MQGSRLVRVLSFAAILVGAACMWCGAHWTPSGLEETPAGRLHVPDAVTSSNPNPSPVGPAPTLVPRSDDRVWVSVPAVGIDAPVTGTLHRSRGMWWPPSKSLGVSATGARLEATAGTTMLAGHVWEGTTSGVLYKLHDAQPGMAIGVTASHGTVSRFVVTDVRQVLSDRLPSWVWGAVSGPRCLVIVTCAGQPTDGAGPRHWSHNLIVTARQMH